MAEKSKPIRDRGRIEVLPSGSLRVTVHVGTDKLTGARNNRNETSPPQGRDQETGPRSLEARRSIKRRFVTQVDERRHPRTNATVNELLDKYFALPAAQREVEPETIESDKSRARTHIRTLIGEVKLADLDAEVFDSFYGELLRCRRHCRPGTRLVDHRCKEHQCRLLANDSVRLIHTILSGALSKAVRRWKWLTVNPNAEADPPPAPAPDPNPPTPQEIGAIINAAWKADPGWGLLIWMAVRTGARRGEICAWSWDRLDLDTGVLRIETVISESDTGQMREKSHQDPPQAPRDPHRLRRPTPARLPPTPRAADRRCRHDNRRRRAPLLALDRRAVFLLSGFHCPTTVSC